MKITKKEEYRIQVAAHELLLVACSCEKSTTEEKEILSFAASMWAADERLITDAEIYMANEILGRGRIAKGNDEESAEYELVPFPAYSATAHKMKVLTGQNAGREFLVEKTSRGWRRGSRTFKSLEQAAAAFAANI